MTTFNPGRALAPHITWGEMVATGHRSLADLNADESVAYLDALSEIAGMLSRVRQHFGAPLIVHSGFRCPTLNSVIGGAKSSQHMRGEAADFHVHGVELRTVFDWIRLESGLLYGQVILEGVQKGRPTWIHLSLGEPWRPASRSRQALIMDGAGNYSVAK